MNNKISILSTVALEPRLTEDAAARGVLIDGVPFINVEAITSGQVKEEVGELCRRNIVAVFTSANAVRAISEQLKELQPVWNIYCIGHATKVAVLEYFEGNRLKGIANDAAVLAEEIKAAQIAEVVFFCGDKRMDTLPELLQADHVSVHEVVVYHTMETPQIIEKVYNAILFFSPSSVHSFFSINKAMSDTVLFAIGNTTANALQQYTSNKMIVSGKPSKEEMIADAIRYFHKQEPVTAGSN
ncbi:MAG: Uroporphyrinogen synthase [Flavipsychrobacter sp.]|nr:Uroporphyrinogen synthase [Flavipsychrobacter sp.]